MANHLVQRVREVYKERPELARLLDESVAAVYGLTPPEVKALAAALLAGESGVQAAHAIAEREGLDLELFETSLYSLRKKGLLKIADGQFDFTPAQERLRMQTPEEVPSKPREAPDCRVVPRPLREVVMAMASSGRSPAAGLGAVYSFVFGRPVGPKGFGVLGKIANLIGTRDAALMMLSHATHHFDGDPLNALLALATAQSKEWRPEGAPDPEEQAAERRQSDEASWRLRMRKWVGEYGGENHALASIDQAEEMTKQGLCNPPYWPEQAEADRRQVKLDFDRWRRAGKPDLRNFL